MFDYEVDADGVATITWNQPDRAANVLNKDTMAAWFAMIDRALADEAVVGVVVASAKKDFIAGGDLESLLAANDPAEIVERGRATTRASRKMETGGKPFVAAIGGSALGGGLEICLACHARVAADDPRIRLGLPEVTLGLLPGAGGTQRLPRLIGINAALPLMLEGKRIGVAEAAKLGLVDEVAPKDGLIAAAKTWVLDEAKRRTVQPWDAKGFRTPDLPASIAEATKFFMPWVARVQAKTQGALPAPKNILSCVFHGSRVDIETGLDIERRQFAATATSPEAKNMIRTGFFAMGRARKLAGRPEGVETRRFARIGVLGAGMMGAGIAYSAAKAGIEVVLLDRDAETAARGKAHSETVLAKLTKRGRIDEADAAAVLARVTPTADYADLAGVDMVIEAVFEDRALKADVTKAAEAVIGDGAIFASNTSTLPITGLAEASARPESFIGLHFFSPVDRMPLVEVIVGEKTDDRTLAEALDFVAAIGKTPIVVNDSRGFFTSRVFRSFVSEGLAMLAEGVAPALIENAAKRMGMPVGPLAVSDEVSIELSYKVRMQTKADLDEAYRPDAGHAVVVKMVEEIGRLGRKAGGGFYDYPADGPKRLWPGFADHFPRANRQPDVEEVVKRLACIQSLETARCLQEGVLRRAEDGDVGAILGWGFPVHRGGPVSQIHMIGVGRFVEDCRALAEAYGARFEPPRMLVEMAEAGEAFYAA